MSSVVASGCQLALIAVLLACVVHLLTTAAASAPHHEPLLRPAATAAGGADATSESAAAAVAAAVPAAVTASRATSPPLLTTIPTAKPSSASLVSCAELQQWDDTHFSHDQDWVPLADGRRVQPDTLWQWIAQDGHSGHLRSRASGGHLNFRAGGFVRGHGNRLPRRPARASPSTLLERAEVEFDRFALDGAAACAPARTVTLRFRKGRAFVHVEDDGGLAARRDGCAGEAECAFAWEPQPQLGPDWLVLRSRRTGRLLRMVDDSHVAFSSWEGIFAPRARLKSAARLAAERRAAVAAAAGGGVGGSGGCPLLPAAAPPPGWAYNATRHAAAVGSALAPWYDGNLSATALDMVFWRDLYPYANRAELPSLHLAVSGGALFYKWQRDADGGAGGAGGANDAPPPGSADAQLVTMLAQVAQVVALPDAEAVAHTAPLPKVPAQNPELVLAPVGDAAHNDVPAPSPWLWAGLTAAAAPPPPPCGPPGARAAQLLVLAECEAPPEGARGPLWPFYAAHRALALARRHPRLLRVALRRPCTRGAAAPAALRRLPIEEAWDRRAAHEVRAAAAAAAAALGEAAVARAATGACAHRWLLLLEGAGPPRELAARMRQGFTIFKQASPYAEFYHAQLRPWTHYVPVAANLEDLPARARWAARHPEAAAAIARNAQALAASLHVYEVACFWWQLLTAMAPLQNFEPRTSSALGFVPAQRRRPSTGHAATA